MSALERASQKKKKDVDRTRRLSAVNMVLAGNGSDSPAREENPEKPLSSAMANLSVHQVPERVDRERERERLNHVSQHGGPNNVSTSSVNGSPHGPNAGSKDTFLNYFFGGPQQRNDRPILQETAHRSGNVHNVAKEMVMPKTVLDGEPLDFDKKLDYMTDTEEFSGLNEREDMETQLIRKTYVFYSPGS